ADVLTFDLVGQTQRRLAIHVSLPLYEGAQLSVKFEEGDHSGGELSMHESKANGGVGRGIAFLGGPFGSQRRRLSTAVGGETTGRGRRLVEANNFGGASHGLRLVAYKLVVELLGYRDEEEEGVAPGSIDLGPIDGFAREATEAEGVDGCKGAIVAYAECIVID